VVNLYLGGAPYYDLDAEGYGREDIRFYRRYADRLAGTLHDGSPEETRVLELACGTGRVSLPLAQAGFSVTGLDLSDAMLTVFAEKLDKEPRGTRERLSLYLGNMADFQLLEAPFDLIIIPFRGFQALIETSDALSALNCVKRHLAPEGLFIVDLFAVAPFNRWLDDFQERVEWRRRDPATGDEIVRARIAGACDTKRQLIHPTTVYYVKHPDGRTHRIEDEFSLRYYFQHQMETLLVASGFEIVEEFGDYLGAPIGEGAEQLFVCRHIRKPKLLG
jgi:SAM-dependent methyltransferase